MTTDPILFWFPRTKLFPPQVGQDVVARPQLAKELYQAVLSHRLTLLSAPAGSGKTTAVAALHETQPDLALGWMSLDEEDSDPLTFLALFIAALQQCLPHCGDGLADLIQSGMVASVSPRRLIALLINDVLETDPAPFVIVLDDLHRVSEAAVFEALDYLLEQLPPPMHLVITTRVDPPLALARLRTRGQLAEFRLPDLRFSQAEIARYLNQQWDLALSSADVDALRRQTEGWAASLHLLATRLDELAAGEERSTYIDSFANTNRLIFDLLADEVLDQQPLELRQFLLETSILNELTPALCAAVTQNSNAAKLLDQAYRRNLFLVAIEEKGTHETAYRYHALFANFLQRRLARDQPDALAACHRRAAQAQASPEQAIHHYLAAQAWEEAADVLEKLGRAELARRFVRRHIAQEILRLPADLLADRPWLQLILANYYAQSGAAAESGRYLAAALDSFRTQQNEPGQIEALVAECWRMGGMIDGAIREELAAKINARPDRFRPDQLAGYHSAAQWYFHDDYDWARITHHVRANLELAQRTGDPGAIMTVASAFGPELLPIDGGMAPIEGFANTALARGNLPAPVRLFLRAMMAYIRFYQARIDAAESLIRPVEDFLHQLGGYVWVEGHVTWLRLSLMQLRQPYALVASAVEDAQSRIAANPTNAVFLSGLVYFQARAAWQQDRLSEVEKCLDRLRTLAENSIFPQDDQARLLILRGLLALERRKFEEGEALLQQAIQLHKRIRHTALLTDPQLALALLYHAWQRPDAALLELSTTLTKLQERGMPGVVLQEGVSLLPVLELATERGIQRDLLAPLIAILRRAQEPQPAKISASGETLSAREMEVLQLLATGASNRAIGEQLVVTERTIKAHVSSILAKLEVSSRTEAVARARALRLLA